MKKILGFALITLFLSCQQGQKKDESPAVDPNAVTCEGIGPVKLSFDHEALINQVGAENVKEEVVEMNGKNAQVSVVFGNSPEEIRVIWNESEAPFKTINKIEVRNNNSPYKTENGIRVGTTLEELRTFNNFQPISMTNFFVNLDGFADVTSFNGGDIELAYPCLGLKLDVIDQKALDVGIRDDAKKETELKSSHRVFAMLDIAVVELSVKN